MENSEIENHPIIKNHKINYTFVINHYGESLKFINEILHTEGILEEEHEILRTLRIKKHKYESKGCHWFVLGYGLFHFYKTLKIKPIWGKTLMFGVYLFAMFDISYKLGRNFGLFIQMPNIFNKLMNMRDGKSIHALQARLFVKRCLIEEKEKKEPKVGWKDSYLLQSIFEKPIARFKNISKIMKNFVKSTFDKDYMRDMREIRQKERMSESDEPREFKIK